ncbi:hypothetical protein DKP78_20415, partial [Enterococcus faecium]
GDEGDGDDDGDDVVRNIKVKEKIRLIQLMMVMMMMMMMMMMMVVVRWHVVATASSFSGSDWLPAASSEDPVSGCFENGAKKDKKESGE